MKLGIVGLGRMGSKMELGVRSKVAGEAMAGQGVELLAAGERVSTPGGWHKLETTPTWGPS